MVRSIFLILIIILFSGCSPVKEEKGVFYTAGCWDIPPAYHGNPWAPGGVGAALSYVYEPLFIYIPGTKEFIPRLGESFQESDDKLTLTIKLRKNVFWHDGEKFSARDVQTTFYIGYIKGLEIWRNLSSVECEDENTIVLKWKRASPTNTIRALTEYITSPYHIFGHWSDQIPEIYKKREALGLNDKEGSLEQNKIEQKVREILYKFHPEMPIGTGPFHIQNVTSSDIILEKFPKYYDILQVDISKVHIIRWGSNEVVWAYLMAGELDGVAPACPYDVTREIMKRNPSTSVVTPSDLNEFGLLFNCTRKPTSDYKFRHAVSSIINRDVIRQVAYTYGETVDDYSLGIPKSVRREWLKDDFYKGLTEYKYDQEKAKELLLELGYKWDETKHKWLTPQGKEILLEIVAPAGQNDFILLAEAAGAQLTKFGIPAEVRVIPMDIYSTTVMQERNFDIATESGAQLNKFGHPSVSFNRFYQKGSIIQVSSGLPSKLKYKDEMIDTEKLVYNLNLTVDAGKSAEMIEKLAWITNENLAFLPCYEKHILIFTADGKRVTGWPAKDDKIWSAAPGGIENLFCTMIVKGKIRSVK